MFHTVSTISDTPHHEHRWSVW